MNVLAVSKPRFDGPSLILRDLVLIQLDEGESDEIYLIVTTIKWTLYVMYFCFFRLLLDKFVSLLEKRAVYSSRKIRVVFNVYLNFYWVEVCLSKIRRVGCEEKILNNLFTYGPRRAIVFFILALPLVVVV